MGGGSGSGGGASIDRIATKAAQAQISAKQSKLGKSLMGKVPGMSMVMGNLS